METDVARGPKTLRASPPGISLLRKKMMTMTPRITTIACINRLIRKPVTWHQPEP